mgnify:CR=1 FL=1
MLPIKINPLIMIIKLIMKMTMKSCLVTINKIKTLVILLLILMMKLKNNLANLHYLRKMMKKKMIMMEKEKIMFKVEKLLNNCRSSMMVNLWCKSLWYSFYIVIKNQKLYLSLTLSLSLRNNQNKILYLSPNLCQKSSAKTRNLNAINSFETLLRNIKI